MAPNNAEANTAVSSAWIDPLRIHLESARKISVFWGASKGNTWHLVHVFHVTHTTQEDSPEVVTLVRPGDVEGVEHDAQAVEPEQLAQDLWEWATHHAGAEVEAGRAKGNPRGRLEIYDADLELLNDAKRTQKRLPVGASGDDDTGEDEYSDERELSPELRGMRKEIKRLRDILASADKGQLGRISTAAKVESAYAEMGEKRFAFYERMSERLEEDLHARLVENRKDEFWAFAQALLAPKGNMLLDSLGVFLRTRGGRDPRGCLPMPAPFSLWVFRTLGHSDFAELAALGMRSDQTTPDSPGFREVWTELLVKCNSICQEISTIEKVEPLPPSDAAMFRGWAKSVCKTIGHDPRSFPYCTLDADEKA